jgi:hypothetical protein
MHRRYIRLLFSVSAFVAACGGGGAEPTQPTFSGMRVVAGAGVSDTVLAKPVQALIVELLDNGRPRAGVVVRFEGLAVQGNDPNAPPSPGVRVSTVATNDFTGFVSDTTDQNGRASALVQLGTRAGARSVQITCPESGLADTAQFTVLPGNSTQLAPSRPPAARPRSEPS